MNELTGKGDFLGIAPVNFAAYAGLPDLNSSDIALKNCSEPYHQTKLFLYKEASRENFIRQIIQLQYRNDLNPCKRRQPGH